MAEENAGGAPEATTEQPLEGDANIPENSAAATTEPPTEQPETPTDEPAKPQEGKGGDDVKKLKGEAQGLRTKLRTAETERDTHKADADGLRAQVIGYQVRDAVQEQAQTLGVRDNKSAALVADLAIAQGAKLSLDKDGKVQGLDDVLKGIKEKHSFLFFDSPGGSDGGAQGDAPAENANSWFQGVLSSKK